MGGDYSEQAFRSIAWKGKHLIVGFANGHIPRIPLNLPLLKGAEITGVFWGTFTQKESQKSVQNISELVAWYFDGKLNPHCSFNCNLFTKSGKKAVDKLAFAHMVIHKIMICSYLYFWI